MTCMRCGRAYEQYAPFCADCGLPADTNRLRRRFAIGTAIITLLAAAVMQMMMHLPWLKLIVPLTEEKVILMSAYDVYQTADNVGGVVGGVAMIDTWVFWMKTAVIVLQAAIVLTAAVGIVSPFMKKSWFAALGIVPAVIAAGGAGLSIYKVVTLLDRVKTAVIVNAVNLEWTPFVLIMAAAVAVAALAVQACIRSSKCDG